MTNSIEEWDRTKGHLAIGAMVNCVVVRHEPFGMFATIENESAIGLIERVRMIQDGYNTPIDYPPVGSHIMATVLGFRDYSQQVELAMPRKCTESERQSEAEELVEVGLRIGDDGQLMFFGVDGVNELLASGKAVIRIEEGRAIMLKSGESQSGVKMQLRGFSVLVVVASR
jgi:predicted RNA-binding protein with RPS1 domain